MKFIIALLFVTFSFAQQINGNAGPQNVHANTAKRQLEKVHSSTKQTRKSVQFHHNHFVEEMSVAKKVLSETRNVIQEGLKKVTDVVGGIINGKLREVNNLLLSAPVASRNNIKTYIEALDKNVRMEKETRIKSLTDVMKVHTTRLAEMEKGLQNSELEEKQSYETTIKAIQDMASSASDSLKQAQSNPEHKNDLKDVKLKTSQGGVELKQTFREEEHKQRKATKETKRQIRLMREAAQREFNEFKENLKAKVQSMFVDSKSKISKVISDTLERTQAEKDAKEEMAQKQAQQAAGMNGPSGQPAPAQPFGQSRPFGQARPMH